MYDLQKETGSEPARVKIAITSCDPGLPATDPPGPSASFVPKRAQSRSIRLLSLQLLPYLCQWAQGRLWRSIEKHEFDGTGAHYLSSCVRFMLYCWFVPAPHANWRWKRLCLRISWHELMVMSCALPWRSKSAAPYINVAPNWFWQAWDYARHTNQNDDGLQPRATTHSTIRWWMTLRRCQRGSLSVPVCVKNRNAIGQYVTSMCLGAIALPSNVHGQDQFPTVRNDFTSDKSVAHTKQHSLIYNLLCSHPCSWEFNYKQDHGNIELQDLNFYWAWTKTIQNIY